MTTVATRVRKGAKFLDKVRPGWALKIKVPTLDLENGDRCILGQLYGDYSDGINKLLPGDDDERPIAHGFIASDDERGLEATEEYPELDRLWSYEVGLRRCAHDRK